MEAVLPFPLMVMSHGFLARRGPQSRPLLSSVQVGENDIGEEGHPHIMSPFRKIEADFWNT